MREKCKVLWKESHTCLKYLQYKCFKLICLCEYGACFLSITAIRESLCLRVCLVACNKNLAEEAHTSSGVLTRLIVVSRKAGHVEVQRDVLRWWNPITLCLKVQET